MTLRVLDPTWEEGAAGFALAPRLPGLEGSTVGILSNGKKGTAPFFAHLARLLGDRHGVAKVVLRVKRSFSAPAERTLGRGGAVERGDRGCGGLRKLLVVQSA